MHAAFNPPYALTLIKAKQFQSGYEVFMALKV
jgi:hypothetical protein